MADEATGKKREKKAGGAKRKERKAGKAGGGKGGKREGNPVVQEARTRYTDELRKQGVPEAEMKAKLKTHLKEVVKPAMNEAKEGAKSKNLKGPERRKYIQETVRGKLGASA
ncbi:MAG TPA: hypothetical protein VHW69_08710 [Rhizomicrobium sp.]|jgi:hypothetical protein|nr:hypothetical protein [Rhizomicrobium sp.]